MEGAEHVQYLSNGVDDANIFGWRLDKPKQHAVFLFQMAGKMFKDFILPFPIFKHLPTLFLGSAHLKG